MQQPNPVPTHRVLIACDEWAFATCGNRTSNASAYCHKRHRPNLAVSPHNGIREDAAQDRPRTLSRAKSHLVQRLFPFPTPQASGTFTICFANTR